MTKDEILNMPAGKELDALIAEKVMGHDVILDGWGTPHKPGNKWVSDPEGFYTGRRIETGGPHPYYSTNIAAAWEVVEKLQPDFPVLDMYCIDSQWAAKLGDHDNGYGYADTAPLAICRAALLAVMNNAEHKGSHE